MAILALAIDVAVLWDAVTQRMEGRTHSEPARITGVVPRLAPGLPATAEGWRRTLDGLGFREVEAGQVDQEGEFAIGPRRWIVWPPGGPALEVGVQGRTIRSLAERDGRARIAAWDFPSPAISLLVGEARERRSVVPLGDIPAALKRAVVAIEDARFYRHPGLDPRGLARATLRNVQAGRVDQGGSTITQQLAKNMFLTADRTLARKGQEALLALVLEHRYEKDRLLEAYLNEIYLGQRDGFAIMGVGEAARAWFGKEVGALDLAECALLAGAIHAPNRTVPWRHPEEALARRNLVLDRMAELAALPADQIDRARRQDLTWARDSQLSRRAPWFMDELVAGLGDRYSPEALHRDGLVVVSTLDPRVQQAAEDAVDGHLRRLRQEAPELFGGKRHPELALVAIDPRNGAVRALVGGSDYKRSQFDRAAHGQRQPGSAFKPIVLAAAIGDRWPDLGPVSLVDDTAIRIPGAGPGGADWSPRDFDDRELGEITLRQATLQSRNLPFVRLGQELGAERVRSVARAMGVSADLAAVPSLAIGSQEVSPLDMAVAFATLAAGGLRPHPRFLEGVRDRNGDWLERAMPRSDAAIDPRVAAVVTGLLQAVVDDGTAQGVRRAGLRIPVAGKTGTSNDARDAWMVGYTPDLAVAVWMGFDEGEPLGLASTRAAVPLWADFMVRVEPLLSGEDFAVPRGTADAGRRGADRPRSDHLRRKELEREDEERRRIEEEAARQMSR